jgi:hypothetical protein
LLVSWLRTKFALKNRQYPHLMKFWGNLFFFFPTPNWARHIDFEKIFLLN